jgi:hypothetical protein
VHPIAVRDQPDRAGHLAARRLVAQQVIDARQWCAREAAGLVQHCCHPLEF